MRRDFLAREMTMEVIVGAFMVMVFLGLGYFTIILSREKWFAQKITMDVAFKNVMGLREGDNVVARGMPVGKVQSLALREHDVLVTLALEQPLRMKRDYRIDIVSTSMLGGRHLEVEEGSVDEPRVPESIIFVGRRPKDLVADAAEVVSAIKAGIVEGGVIENLRVASEQIRQTTERLNSGKGLMGRLLSEDDTLYNDVAATAASLRAMTARIEKGEGAIGRLMAADDPLYADLSATVASLKALSQRLEKGEGTVGRLLSSDDTLYRDLSASAASLRTISAKIEKGEGTLGRLVNDDAVYGRLDETLSEVRNAIEDFRETSPVTTFTSIFFGAF